MLRIFYRNDKDQLASIEWTLNCSARPLHLSPRPALKADNIELTADGEELVWIKQHFTGIPMVTAARHVRWTGDDALFIARNIPCATGPYGIYFEP
jgi:hypothetical protein